MIGSLPVSLNNNDVHLHLQHHRSSSFSLRVILGKWLFLVTTTTLLITSCQADFGDYVDPTFNCPATTTCPQVCVASERDCPLWMLCAPHETLCADGSCSNSTCDPTLVTPCPDDCAPVACKKIVDTYSQCLSLYSVFYNNATQCAAASAAALEEVSLRAPGFVFFYVWILVVTLGIFAWCFYNQRFAPVPNSRRPLIVEKLNALGDDEVVVGLQTGYKYHPIGLLLHACTVLTLAGWSALLAWLTVQYYIADGNAYVANLHLVFQDEAQALEVFIIVFSVGIMWCFMIKWPHSITSLFLRRCALEEAIFVAVYVEGVNNLQETTVIRNQYWGFLCLKDGVNRLFSGFANVMSVLFSDVDRFHIRGGVLEYCRVHHHALQDNDETRENDGERDEGSEESSHSNSRYISFLFRRYNYVAKTEGFEPARWDLGERLGEIANADPEKIKVGLRKQDVQRRQQAVGYNSIEMKKPSLLGAIGKELTRPFYTYQLFMIWSWMPQYYYYMALGWGFVIGASALTVAVFNYRTKKTLYAITDIEGEVEVLRDGEFSVVDQKLLVPGDIIKIRPGVAYCDMILLSGDKTLVDESGLTGESDPQPKTPVYVFDEFATYDPIVHRKHTIFAGTRVTETDASTAVVTKTGSFTSRGELIREIFAYKRHQFKFDSEVYIVLCILGLYAIFGFVMVNVFIVDSAVYSWFYGIYVVGTSLPPLLPTVFTISVFVSDIRLARKGIATVNAECILVAGKVTHAFFDKTGTLTKQSLDFLGAVTMNNDRQLSSLLWLAMSTCHTLKRTKKGKVAGNPVDAAMFEASGAILDRTKGGSTQIIDRYYKKVKVIRRFDFDHNRMMQSVVVELEDGSILAFVKGSGESIKQVCSPSSLPRDFDASLRKSALSGIYQLSVAVKPIRTSEVGRLTQQDVESDLEYLGVLNFKNVLRDDTRDVVEELTKADVKSIMVTGDSVLSGLRAAGECGMLNVEKEVIVGSTGSSGEVVWSDESGAAVDLPSSEYLQSGMYEVAVSGECWDILRTDNPKLIVDLSNSLRVVGRCTPYEKVSVVKSFVEQGLITLMCGDGGNDAGALKVAHVGVALSDSEASIVAPFTSLRKEIGSVVEILKEGRCALASALATYKYIIMYGQIETINQTINAYYQITFTEWCWVFMDGIWTITLAFTLPLARPAEKLSNTRPTGSILGAHTLASVLGVLVLNFLFTVIALATLSKQDWYQCRKWNSTNVSNALVIGDNYESEVLFLVTGFQYISSAMVYNFGYEFRKGWFSNYVFVILVSIYSGIMFYITMVPGKLSCVWRVNCVNENVVRGVTAHVPFPIQNPFNTTIMPHDFRVKVLALMIVNTVAIMAYDFFVVNGLRRRWGAERRRKAFKYSRLEL